MPNWYNGNVTITGDITPFRKWAEKNKNENLDYTDFAQTFAPLSSGEWNYDCACKEWGTKWDLTNIQINSGEKVDDQEFSFCFDTAWSAPIHLWKQLEKKYNVEVEEFGYEEQQLGFHKYKKGRNIWFEMDDEWFEDKFDFTPSDEAKNDTETYEDELRDHKYDNWCDALDDWQEDVKDDHPEWEVVTDYDTNYDHLMSAISSISSNLKICS
jgi:hypothetical protein